MTDDTADADARRCSACFHEGMEPGFIMDNGSGGQIRWIVGPLEKGLLGIPKTSRRPRRDLHGWSCPSCGKVDLYLGD